MLRCLIFLLLIDQGFGHGRLGKCGKISKWSYGVKKDLIIYGIEFMSPASNDAAFDIFVQDASGQSTLCRSVKKNEFKPRGDVIYIECGRIMEGRSASIRMKAGSLLSHCGTKVDIVAEYKPIPTRAAPTNQVPAGYSDKCARYNVHYKYHSTGATFANSVKICKAEGGELVVPQSLGEANCLVEYVAKVASKKVEFAFLNLKVKKPSKSHLLDSNNNRRSYMESFWSKGFNQPDRAGAETCVGITTGGNRFKGKELGKLHDIYCSWSIPFVCARRTVPSGYKRDCARHGVYYKYHNSPLTFTKSQEKCKKEGGELVVPQSAAEAKCLVEYVAKTASKKVEFAFLNLKVQKPNKIHILDSNNIRRSYMESFWSKGYNQPDRAGAETCVGITVGGNRFKGKELGKLHDISCSWAIPFVCAYRDVPSGYKGCCASHGVYYNYHNNPLPFTKAQEKCRKEGGKLADPLNAKEASCLIGKFLPKWGNKNAEFVYLDLKVSKPYKTGSMKGLGGVGPVRTHLNAYWSKGYRQPDGRTGEQCVGVTTGGSRFKGVEMGKLHDLYCRNPHRFVCEFRK